jgi:hypothetical protein
MLKRCLFAAFLTGGFSLSLQAQAPEFPAVRVEEPPVIDGTVAQEEWAFAEPLENFFDGSTQEPAPDQATLYLAYDDEFIYLAGRLFSDPGQLTAEEYQKNVGIRGDDEITFEIDPFGSLAGFNRFSVNPRGATSIGITGGRAAKSEWIGRFDAESSITEDGWEFEARIPWAIMSLPGPGMRNMRFNLDWYISRYDRRYTFRYVGNDRAGEIPVWLGVDFPRIEKARTINLLPFSYFGFSEDEPDEWIINSGLDLKTGLTDRIELVGTVNPDFRNIEGDILDLSFSNFERLAGEARPFFQEGAGFLDDTFGSTLFASQRIDQFDTGLNSYGYIDDRTAFGALTTVDFGEEQSTVATLVREEDYAEIGFQYVGWDKPGEVNRAMGTRAEWDIGNWELDGRTMFTDDQVRGSGWSNRIGFNHGGGGFYVGSGYSETSPDFFPRIGFAPRTDRRGYYVYSGWSRFHPRGTFQSTRIDVDADYFETFDGDLFSKEFEVSAGVNLRNGLEFDVGSSWENFQGSPDRLHSFNVGYPNNSPYRNVRLGYSFGDLAGEEFRRYSASASYRLFPRSELGVRYDAVSHFQERDLLIVNFSQDLGDYRSLGGRVVRRNDDWNFYVSYNRSGTEGIEYFVILGDPNARSFTESLIFKVVAPISVSY